MFNTNEAAELLKEFRHSYQDVSTAAIAKVISDHLEDLVKEALSDPEEFFRHDYGFWRDLDKAAASETAEEELAA